MTSRQPLVGFNHSLPYKGRTYHVQTEDSGVSNPHIFSHLFHQGLIIASAKAVYEPASPPDDVRGTMKSQHKSLMKQLVRGELDQKIGAMLGGLEPDALGAEGTLAEQRTRIRSYHHRLNYGDRVYSIQTYFYSTVVTDVFHEKILVTSHLQDCREETTPGSEEVTRRAQDQHKEMIRQLRDGAFDERVTEILGSVRPQSYQAERQAPRRVEPLKSYTHRIGRFSIKLDVRTQLFPPETPNIITEVFHEGRLLTTANFFDYSEVAAEDDAMVFAEELAKHQHTEALKQIVGGGYDDLLRLTLTDAFLDAMPTHKISTGQ